MNRILQSAIAALCAGLVAYLLPFGQQRGRIHGRQDPTIEVHQVKDGLYALRDDQNGVIAKVFAVRDLAFMNCSVTSAGLPTLAPSTPASNDHGRVQQ